MQRLMQQNLSMIRIIVAWGIILSLISPLYGNERIQLNAAALSPEVKRILTIEEEVAAENAYVALMAINAPQADYYSVGKRTIEENLHRLVEALKRQDRSYLTHHFRAPEDFYAAGDELILDLRDESGEDYPFPFNDYAEDVAIIEQLMADRSIIEQLLERNGPLMERYRQLITLPLYESYELTTLSIYPSYIILMDGLSLNLANLLYQMDRGDVEGGLATLEAELHLSEAMITHDNQIYDRVVGTHRYLMIYGFIADLLDYPHKLQSKANYERLLGMISPINRTIRGYLFNAARVERNNILRELALNLNDRATIERMVDEMPIRVENRSIPVTFDPNDTLNFFYQMSEIYLGALEYATLPELYAMPPFKAEYALEEIYQIYGKENISGRHLIKTLDFPDFRQYIYQYYNALIHIDLVSLKRDIKAERIPREEVGKYIAEKQDLTAEFPFGHQRVDWDEQRAELSSPLIEYSGQFYEPDDPKRAILTIRFDEAFIED